MRYASVLVVSALAAGFVLPPPIQASVPAALPAVAGDVVIQEITASGPHGRSDGFFELRNVAGHAVDLSEWSVYRCDGDGLRAKRTDPEADLAGVTLAPGQIFTVAHGTAMSVDADARFPHAMDPRGFGLVLVDAEGVTADDVAVYPNAPLPAQTECGSGPNLPVTLAAALGESWQRTSDGTWVRASATPGRENRNAPAAVSSAPVRIDEIAAAGPAGHGDDLVELRNAGPSAVGMAGWRLYRCARTGVLTAETLQHEFDTGSRLAAGERFVIGGPDFDGAVDARAATSLADGTSGVLLVDAEGRRVDGLSVSSDADTACQTGDTKLAADLDYRTGESWQRTASGQPLIAPRTPGAPNAERQRALMTATRPEAPTVAISEVATDPPFPGGHGRRNFVELANYADHPVDVSGWTLIACGENGFRRFDALASVPRGTTLAPGDTWVAALSGTPAALRADASYEDELDLRGAGVWLEDAAGRRVDRVGIFHRNEMDADNAQPSACTNGLPLPTFAVDRLRAESYQRTGFSGDDAADFRPAAASPGLLRTLAPVTLDDLADQALAAAQSAAPRVAESEDAAAPEQHPSAAAADVRAAVAGHASGPLVEREGLEERAVDGGHLVSRNDGYDHPYLRLRVAAPDGGAELGWSGRVVGRGAVRLSVWDTAASSWRTLDEEAGGAVADDASAQAVVHLAGAVRAGEVVAGEVELLVQSVPRPSALDAQPEPADAGDYDLALSHMTDTQYYSEAYPEVYAAQVAWIAANAAPRRIAFAAHTGDLVQNWIDPDQGEERARREFETASRFQRVLDDAGIPNSVLPGNHDNKRGVTDDLFNEYFPPERYAGTHWYGGSIAADDNSANYSTFERAGARFLVLSLPYGYTEADVSWAEAVVRDHADHNVVVATHEHLTPMTSSADAARSTSSRWLSRADLLWDRVIAPHRNVSLVLSGHFHGIGAIVTEDAGGIPGHTVVEALGDYQEFRTRTGERATGFQRLLQLDLGGGRLAVDTLSVPLKATSSHPYDYGQFVADDGQAQTPSNERPWNIVGEGLQHRYTAADDAFTVELPLQYAKAVETDAVWIAPGPTTLAG